MHDLTRQGQLAIFQRLGDAGRGLGVVEKEARQQPPVQLRLAQHAAQARFSVQAPHAGPLAGRRGCRRGARRRASPGLAGMCSGRGLSLWRWGYAKGGV